MGSLDSGVATRLMEMTSMAAYAPPHFLFYLEERTLRAQRFDSSRLTLAGVPATIASGVLHSASSGQAAFAVSDAGTLAYRTGPNDMGQHSLMWLDRTGKTLGIPVGEPIRGSVHQTVTRRQQGGLCRRPRRRSSDIWIQDIERSVRTQLTHDPFIDHGPVWSPDGSRVGFDASHGTEVHVLYQTTR